jgi:butyrate kinase
LPPGPLRVLVINPGSTSTKFAVYADEKPEFTANLRHSDAELEQFRGRPILDQQPFRAALIEGELSRAGYALNNLRAVAGRGGLLRPLASGTYRVNQAMLEELRAAERGQHASNLGAVLALEIAQRAGVEAYVVDPVSVDEWTDRARLSGSALLERYCLSHALNTKAVSKRYAREVGKPYEQLRLIVAHVGAGSSISAHEDGRMIDGTNTREDGPFSGDRAGAVPCNRLVELCFSGKYTCKQVQGILFGEGGLYSYLGTKELVEVERRIAAGDGRAALVFDAMVYQIGKEIGAMAAVLRGRVDAVLLTGGMAHSEKLVGELRPAVEWIAPLVVYPGEDELQALAEGTLRVLRGEEQAREFGQLVPALELVTK